MAIKTIGKCMFLISLLAILSMLISSPIVYSAGEPGSGGGGGDDKYTGPAGIADLMIFDCEDGTVEVFGHIKCKGVEEDANVDCGLLPYEDLCPTCTTFDEITADDLIGFEIVNDSGLYCGISGDLAVRVITKFDNSDGQINVRGVLLFLK